MQRLCTVVCPTLLKWCGWTAAAHSQPLRNVRVSSLWLCLSFLRGAGFWGAKQQEALRTFHVFQCWVTAALSQETCILPSQAQKECAEKLATQLEEVWNKTKSHMKSTMAACDTCQFLWCGTALMMRQDLSDTDRRLLQCALTEALWEVSLAMTRFAQTVEECSIGMMIQMPTPCSTCACSFLLPFPLWCSRLVCSVILTHSTFLYLIQVACQSACLRAEHHLHAQPFYVWSFSQTLLHTLLRSKFKPWFTQTQCASSY